MKYTTERKKREWLIMTLLVFNLVIVAAILADELKGMQQPTDNLAICQDTRPAEEWHLCFDWAQAVTDWNVNPGLALGGNVIIYALFRTWSAGQYDSQIKRLMGQAYRLSDGKISSYVPIILDDGWTGVLTYKCRNLYDDYIVAVTNYNKSDLTVEELQKYAKKLFGELSEEYGVLEEEATGRISGP